MRLGQVSEVDPPRGKSNHIECRHGQQETDIPERGHRPQDTYQHHQVESPAKTIRKALGLARRCAHLWRSQGRISHYFGTSTEPMTSVSTRSLVKPSSPASGC